MDLPTEPARRPRARGGRTGFAALALGAALVLGACATVPQGVSHAAPSSPTDAAAHTEAGADRALDTFALLRQAADHEGLYCLVGGLKPMSTGIWRGELQVENPDLKELRAVRAALAPVRNEVWYADVMVFAKAHEGERSADAYVVHRGALARTIERFGPFWSQWGIAPCTHPAEVVAIVERLPEADRWRAYGYLFGVPAEAVEFFVEAGQAAAGRDDVGPGKDRQFVQIPTFAAESGRFTYAVPLHHERTAADEALASEASRILRAYAERREGLADTGSLIAGLRRLDRQFEPSAASAAVVRDER